ncbi:immunity 26/phosphotriesterase HocA family protein [Paradesertivirga mongoliensis]|uniref:Immunity 26/phosphotriesterase HocA family protein n=1 Tax=Paradesertivirga mongoliensis TaxID=2100740 RepID=A0ABW4ZKK2_9SPHI|nr:immunity 26/phosphotriesterase HocA family protein [Pedobacter mongoliensis]
MARQQRTVGAFLKINLPNGKFGYARILKEASYAIYDLTTYEVVDVNEIAKHNVLFFVAVYDDVVTSGRWEKIGKRPLEEQFFGLPMKFIQDAQNPDKFSLYDPNSGDITAANKEDCLGLERAAVWEAEHVEERIVDHYEGRPNRWVEEMKAK